MVTLCGADANTLARTNVPVSNSVPVVANVSAKVWVPLSISSKEAVTAWLLAALCARSSSIWVLFAICAAVSAWLARRLCTPVTRLVS